MMSTKISGYYITLWLILFCALPLGWAAADTGPRWVETARWSGSGTVFTDPFYLAGERWRVRFYPDGPPPFDILVCDATAKPVGRAAVSEAAVPGWRTFDDNPGYRILHIVGPKVRWTVTVEQLMTMQQQWKLSRQQKAHPPVYRQTGLWSGDGSSAPLRFPLPIQDAPWRLRVQNQGPGELTLTLRNAAGEAVVQTNGLKGGTMESWGYKAGDYSLDIEAAESPWTVQLYGAGLKQ